MTTRASILIIACIFICLVRPGSAQTTSTPPKLLAAILFKALSYDRRLNDSSENLVIGIVENRNERKCAQENTILDAFRSLGNVTIHSRKTQVIVVDVSALDKHPVQVFFLTRCVDAHLERITAFAKKNKILTITGVHHHMASNVGMAIIPSADRRASQIVVNLERVREEGANFDSRFLRLVKLLRKP